LLVVQAFSPIVRTSARRLTALHGVPAANVANVIQVSVVVIATIVANYSARVIRAKSARRQVCRFASICRASRWPAMGVCLRQ
jgi:hypothetical protein